MNPCGSGQRLVRNGAYEGLPDGGRTREAHDWSFDRKDFPLYCTHCSFMNESLPIQWSGYPLYPCDPPGDYSKDPCTWYWYKDPDDIPERHYAPLRGGQAGARSEPYGSITLAGFGCSARGRLAVVAEGPVAAGDRPLDALLFGEPTNSRPSGMLRIRPSRIGPSSWVLASPMFS